MRGVHARASDETARLETRETRAEAREENSFFRVYVFASSVTLVVICVSRAFWSADQEQKRWLSNDCHQEPIKLMGSCCHTSKTRRSQQIGKKPENQGKALSMHEAGKHEIAGKRGGNFNQPPASNSVFQFSVSRRNKLSFAN